VKVQGSVLKIFAKIDQNRVERYKQKKTQQQEVKTTAACLCADTDAAQPADGWTLSAAAWFPARGFYSKECSALLRESDEQLGYFI
jgi:hypothetical protein